MIFPKIYLAGTFAMASLGCSFLIAQDNHNDAPPSTPVTTPWDVSSLKFTPQEQKNIDFVKGYYRECIQSHHYELVDKYLAKDEINHNPNDPKTPAGLMALLLSRFPKPEPMHKDLDPIPNVILAKGNMVLLGYEADDKDPRDPSKTYRYLRVEMVRLQNGKIQEHWDVGDRRVGAQTWKIEWCMQQGRTDCPSL